MESSKGDVDGDSAEWSFCKLDGIFMLSESEEELPKYVTIS